MVVFSKFAAIILAKVRLSHWRSSTWVCSWAWKICLNSLASLGNDRSFCSKYIIVECMSSVVQHNRECSMTALIADISLVTTDDKERELMFKDFCRCTTVVVHVQRIGLEKVNNLPVSPLEEWQTFAVIIHLAGFRMFGFPTLHNLFLLTLIITGTLRIRRHIPGIAKVGPRSIRLRPREFSHAIL